MDLVLSSEDFVLLKSVLERYISNLRMEIAGTDSADWRKEMHADEDRAKQILARLESARPGSEVAGQPNTTPVQIVVEGFFLVVE
jgi:hypothetical protein